jgi:hypothetical protein
MANTFKNFRGALTTGGVECYVCPANTTAIVLHLQIANVHATDSADVTVHWTDDSVSDAVTRLASTVVVPSDTSLSVLTGKLVLMAGDTIVGKASADSKLELSGSVLEMS